MRPRTGDVRVPDMDVIGRAGVAKGAEAHGLEVESYRPVSPLRAPQRPDIHGVDISVLLGEVARISWVFAFPPEMYRRAKRLKAPTTKGQPTPQLVSVGQEDRNPNQGEKGEKGQENQKPKPTDETARKAGGAPMPPGRGSPPLPRSGTRAR